MRRRRPGGDRDRVHHGLTYANNGRWPQSHVCRSVDWNWCRDHLLLCILESLSIAVFEASSVVATSISVQATRVGIVSWHGLWQRNLCRAKMSLVVATVVRSSAAPVHVAHPIVLTAQGQGNTAVVLPHGLVLLVRWLIRRLRWQLVLIVVLLQSLVVLLPILLLFEILAFELQERGLIHLRGVESLLHLLYQMLKPAFQVI
mmetsp:Transcript_22087/g.39609  ORF Transcript_22087/g.39609 Transcript_22087/m.39609 type:complete len:202 (+) Transcript_22087:478-1083(+)